MGSASKDLNLRSEDQLRALLFSPEGMRLAPVGFTDGGQPSTNEDSLKAIMGQLTLPYALRHESSSRNVIQTLPKKNAELATASKVAFLDHLFTFRNATKALDYLSSYRTLALREGRLLILRTSFNQCGTDTTRFSSSDPNLQNVSKQEDAPLRSVFCPRPGCTWYAFDYDQLELRLFAFIAKEPRLAHCFANNIDAHLDTGILFLGKPKNDDDQNRLRRIGKTINFAILYGAGSDKINRAVGNPEAYEQWKKLYPVATKYMRELMAEVRRTGCVRTLHGYPLSTPAGRDYAAVNYKVQGSAGSILKSAMRNVNAIIGPQPKIDLVLTIHDELIVESAGKLSKNMLGALVHAMEAAGAEVGATTPVSVSMIPRRWSEKEPLPLAV
jgi:DNA polymerase I-like protein with 3'-5' exonuclease and polymerase domains